MKKFRIIDIVPSFGIFIDDEYEAENEYEALDMIFNEIIDNIGNYIDIDVEEVQEDERC
jgi:hypothetical protein